MDGTVLPNMLSAKQQVIAARTLALTGLEKRMSEVHDENGHRIAIDRVSQRLQAWGKAQAASDLLHRTPDNEELRVLVAMLAEEAGFFSIWMTVFANDSDMCKRLIEAFPGTSESGCFDPTTTVPISPAPNPDGLPHGGKI